MARGDDNILFDPSKLMARSPKSVLQGVDLPSRGKKIFAASQGLLVLTEEDNLISVDFSEKSVEPSDKISHTEGASIFKDTLVAFHENGVGYEQFAHPSIGIHSHGLRWQLSMPFVAKERGVKGLSLQALDGQALIHDPREGIVYACQFPDESEMAYTESLLSPSLWQERSRGVTRFCPGEGGALLFFGDEVDPLYVDASGREYRANFFTEDDLMRSDNFLHAPAGEAGKVYFTDGSELKIFDLLAGDFFEGSEKTFFQLPGRPKKMTAKDDHLALLLPDRIIVFNGMEKIAEEKIGGVEDIAWRGDSLLLLSTDKIEEKSLAHLDQGTA